jgi:hypothetical protein
MNPLAHTASRTTVCHASRIATLSLLALAITSQLATAQTIERVRMTDSELSCNQIYAEAQQMDTMIGAFSAAPAPLAAAAPAAPAAPANNAPAVASLFGSLGSLLGGGGNATQGAQGLGALASALSGNGNNGAANPLGALASALGNGNGNGSANPDVVRQLLQLSQDERVRASANDPAALAQYQALLANPQTAAALQQAAANGGNAAQLQGVLSLLGQASAGQAPAPAAAAPVANVLGGLFGAFTGNKANALGGGDTAGAVGLFGKLLQTAATAAPAAPAPAAAPVAAAPTANNVIAQAQGRKEHLTGLFLSKGCKISDVKK